MSQQPYRPDEQPGHPQGGRGDDASMPGYSGRNHPSQVAGEERSMALVAHLSTLVAMIVSAGWLSFVGPLIVWFMYRDRSEFVRRSAAGAFNFNLGMWLLALLGWICVLTLIGAVIGIPILIFAAIAQIVCHVIGAVKANKGELYRYPFQLRILG